MKSTSFESVYCSGTYAPLLSDDQFDFIVVGKIKEPVDHDMLYYFAASPPDYRATYTGSGLPFANQPQAFENSPNRGSVKLINNTFEIKLVFPNSYYVGLGTVLVPPAIHLRYKSITGEPRTASVNLSEGIPYRTLTYPAIRNGADFYGKGWSLPVRSQEQILRDSGYPITNTMPSDHWGLKPPL